MVLRHDLETVMSENEQEIGPVTGLPDELALSFLIGEVVRADVSVESELRNVWWHLHRAGIADGPMRRNLGQLVKQVRPALRDQRVPAPFRGVALEVLERGWTAHQTRNKLVHDQWMHLPWDRGRIASMRSATRRDIEDLRRCADELRTLMWRMRGVSIMAPAWLGTHDRGEEEPVDELRSWTRVAMGYIADDPGRVIGTPGDAPMPNTTPRPDEVT
jgi:hypothetical protein